MKSSIIPWKVLGDNVEVLQYLVGNRGRRRVELVVKSAYIGDIFHNLPFLGRKVKKLLRVKMLTKYFNSWLTIELINLDEKYLSINFILKIMTRLIKSFKMAYIGLMKIVNKAVHSLVSFRNIV